VTRWDWLAWRSDPAGDRALFAKNSACRRDRDRHVQRDSGAALAPLFDRVVDDRALPELAAAAANRLRSLPTSGDGRPFGGGTSQTEQDAHPPFLSPGWLPIGAWEGREPTDECPPAFGRIAVH